MGLNKIIAGIDDDNIVRINAKVIGTHESIDEYGAVFDSGFSGDLVLPIEKVAKIGLKPGGVITVQLADGSSLVKVLNIIRTVSSSTKSPI